MEVEEDCSHRNKNNMNQSMNNVPMPNELLKESMRLRSFYDGGFLKWPKQQCITAEEVANAGFYYLGNGDRVTCPWCNLILRDWSIGDVGIVEHKRHSPGCEFVLQPDFCGNVLLNPNKRPSMPVASPDGSKHPQFREYGDRLRTFDTWPVSHVQRPEGLAESGFFYIGQGDNVRCFFCDFGLREWAPEDDPWVEHARWSSTCKYVLEKKGAAFVERAKNGEAAYEPAAAAEPQQAEWQRDALIQSQVEERMNSQAVKVALDMGYDRDIVKRVLASKLKSTGEDFKDSSSLMDAIFEYENTEVVVEETAQSAGEPQASTSRENVVEKSEVVNDATKNEQETDKNLLDEIERLKEQKICKICMDADVTIVFVPCGHMCTCVTCADQVRQCPICRLGIKGRVRAFLT